MKKREIKKKNNVNTAASACALDTLETIFVTL